jgi:hypothetical protein
VQTANPLQVIRAMCVLANHRKAHIEKQVFPRPTSEIVRNIEDAAREATKHAISMAPNRARILMQQKEIV